MKCDQQIEDKRKETLLPQALQCLDAFLVFLAVWLASLLRDPVREALGLPPLDDVGLGGIIVGVVVGVLVIFLRTPDGSRLVLGSAIPIVAVFLLCRAWLVRAIGLRLAPIDIVPS